MFRKRILTIPCKHYPISVDLNNSNPERMWQPMQGSPLMVVIRVLMASEYMHCYDRERERVCAVGK